MTRTLVHLCALPITAVATHGASAAVVGSYTFDAGATSAERLASSGVVPGLTLSSLGLASNGTLEDAGVNALPSSTNDGFGFGGNAGNQIMFWDRAANGVTSSWGGQGNPDTANTSTTAANNIAGMNFTVTAAPDQVVTIDDVFVQAQGSPAYIVAFQPDGALGPAINSNDTSADTNQEARAGLGSPFVILPGQSQDFTLAWNSGGFNQRVLINQIDVGGSVTPVGGATSFTLIDDDFSSGSQGAWSERAVGGAASSFTDDAELTPFSANPQPVSIFQNFNDVSLQDGQALRLTVDASITAGATNANSNVKLGFGYADPRIGGETGALLEAIEGYVVAVGSNGGRVDDNPGTPEFDPDFIFPNLDFIEPTVANPEVNFFNTNPANNEATDIGFFDANITNGQITLDQTPTTLVYEIERSGTDLLVSLSADGLLIDTLTVSGSEVIDNFEFNSVGLSHAFTGGETATFDNVLVEFLTAAASILGDLDSDGDVDVADIDILGSNLGTGTTQADGDLDGDSDVDLDDLTVLLGELGTVGGDANLDQLVDTSDLAILAGNFNNAVSSFGQADFNLDGNVDTADLAILAGTFGFDGTSPLNAASAAVPEPASLGLLGLAALLGINTRRRPA